MKTFRFLDFPVYQEARLLYREIVVITKTFPPMYWELGDQMRRSALSICLNIAEGSAKKSDKDFNRYVEHSLGSVNETVAGLDISFNEGLLNEEALVVFMKRSDSIAKQLGGLSKTLRTAVNS